MFGKLSNGFILGSMAALPKFKKAIQSLYMRDSLDTSLFSWINATRYMFPEVSVDNAINGFYRFYNIDKDLYPNKTARTTYYRMQKELLEMEKTKKNE